MWRALILAVVLFPMSAHAGWITWMIAADAADKAQQAKRAAEETRKAVESASNCGSHCEANSIHACPGCSITCPTGVAAFCANPANKWDPRKSTYSCISEAKCYCKAQ